MVGTRQRAYISKGVDHTREVVTMLNADEIKMATVLVKCEVYVVTFDGRAEKCSDVESSQVMSMTPTVIDHPRLRCNLHKRLDTVIDAMIKEAKKVAMKV